MRRTALASLVILAGCAGTAQNVVDGGRRYDFGSAVPPRLALIDLRAQAVHKGLAAQTLAAIDQAEAQIHRGEGIPVDEAFARLRQKHLGK